MGLASMKKSNPAALTWSSLTGNRSEVNGMIAAGKMIQGTPQQSQRNARGGVPKLISGRRGRRPGARQSTASTLWIKLAPERWGVSLNFFVSRGRI